MTEFTAHIQLPDAAIGAVLYDIALGRPEITCATLKSGNGTWLSVGFHADSDDEATMLISTTRYQIGQMRGVAVPEGYEESSLQNFDGAPMIITCGRTVVYSEGV